GAKIRSLMCAPIVQDEQLLGALYLSRYETPGHFTDEALDLLSVYASQASLIVGTALKNQLLEARANEAERRLEALERTPIVGSSPAMLKVMHTLAKAAESSLPVLLQGESGSGKELFAHELHRLGPGVDRPFVVLNCSAVPAHLLESELFGHA